MDFKLDIGELTNTIRDYENTIKTLAEQKENINKAVKELTDLGWSGAAKDKFLENHAKKQEFYTKLEEDIKYMKSALENEEKPRAVRLKKICEGLEGCIKRSGGGAALTSDDIGIISLEYSGQAPINRNVDECVNNHYKRMDSKFVEILNLVNSLTFTSFPIEGDIEKARKSLKDQTTSLTDFNDSFNEYCSGVKTMESNICSVFGKISGVTEGISKFRGVSDISEGGQVDKNKVMQLMLKNPSGLTNEEKELLSYVEKALGEKNYARLKEAIINGDKNQEIEVIVNSNRDLFISASDNSVVSNNSNIAKAVKGDNDLSFWKPVWDFEDGVNNFLAQHFNNPVGEFMSRISITGGNVATFGNGSKEIADTGSPTANKIADIIGTCGGFVFNPEAGLEGAVGMVKGIKGVQGFIARKIENVGNKAAEYSFENMGQYIRSVLYGHPQVALPNGMGTINTTEDLFKFSKIEGDLTKGAGKAGWKSADLVDELASSGVKYSPDDVVAVTKTADGKLVWLENGNSKAGMQHILDHADDFAKKGIQQDKIQDLVMESLTNGKVVDYQGRGTGRPIYEVTFEGKTYHTAITVGDNGYIVGANPTTWP